MKELIRYTKAVDQARLARNAMTKHELEVAG